MIASVAAAFSEARSAIAAERATWAAITLLVINLVGLGLGPLLVGRLSDWLAPTAGEDSLRWALVIVVSLTPWALFHYWRAGVLMKRAGE